tara:strand:- start:1362 stop:2138 length:777 start_codon:yes stop_codon:yes gene_type:complete
MIKHSIKKLLELFSYEIKKIHELNDLTFNSKEKNNFEYYYKLCERESLNVSKKRFLSLYQSVNYIYKNNISGDFVECGVFRGGSAMMMAYAMQEFDLNNKKNKKLWLYDTFEGMANPSEYDENILNQKAILQLKRIEKEENKKDIWAFSSIDHVDQNIVKTGMAKENIVYVKGLVEKTLLEKKPYEISILRLDTDFYESTKIELEILYPLLAKGGILIVDDYGHWKGCKKAVKEFFVDKKNIFFQQIDYSGIIGVKTK